MNLIKIISATVGIKDADTVVFLSAVAGAIIGGLIAGVFSLLATAQLLRSEGKMRRQEKAEKIRALLSAIHQELSSIYLDYLKGMVGTLNEVGNNQYLEKHLHIIYDFPIYRTNVKDIGLIEDEKLRDAIIVTYALAESMVHKCQQNNEYNKELKAAMIAQNGLTAPHPSLRTLYADKALKEHYVILGNSIRSSMDTVQRTIKLLDAYKINGKPLNISAQVDTKF